jgi:hypothetical protein
VPSQDQYVLPIAISFLSSDSGWALVRETKFQGFSAVYSTTRNVLERTLNGGRSWSVIDSDVR